MIHFCRPEHRMTFFFRMLCGLKQLRSRKKRKNFPFKMSLDIAAKVQYGMTNRTLFIV